MRITRSCLDSNAQPERVSQVAVAKQSVKDMRRHDSEPPISPRLTARLEAFGCHGTSVLLQPLQLQLVKVVVQFFLLDPFRHLSQHVPGNKCRAIPHGLRLPLVRASGTARGGQLVHHLPGGRNRGQETARGRSLRRPQPQPSFRVGQLRLGPGFLGQTGFAQRLDKFPNLPVVVAQQWINQGLWGCPHQVIELTS